METDAIHHERIWLEKPGPERVTWQWLAGVNYFCAQGDRRWWHDHRIPGGMAFSVNSVGHLARAGKIGEVMNNLNIEMGFDGSEFGSGTIRSLEEALVFAMLTIDNAADTVSGRATRLLPLDISEDVTSVPSCPIKLPARILGKNHCTYEGWYHTDYTLPSEYFLPDEKRPSNASAHDLDFTYLFNKHVDNSAFEVMAQGQRIRAEIDAEPQAEVEMKANRMVPMEIPLDKCERLQAALAARSSHQ